MPLTRPQSVIARALQLAGVAGISLPLAAMVVSATAWSELSAGLGLYKLLAIATGFAMLTHGAELNSAAGWENALAWWNTAPSARLANIGRILAIAGELALLWLVIRAFEIENHVFVSLIVPLTFVGFLIHHFTPARQRLRLFLFFSFAAVWLVFGFPDALWLIGAGVMLVGICHLPIPYRSRVAMVGSAGIALAAARVDRLPVPWSRTIWPILGSMFMFRMIVYLYDLRHERVPSSWSQRLAYFFLLPNVVFPLFPVVDYAAFRRTWYDTEAHRIYQRGVQWIFRGIVQLILYRLVNQHLMVSSSSVTTGVDLARFMVANFLLYLRVSGQFHLIIGLLHLFGFHLPETHRLYYLASSFTDFWRRINIYWKDFMTKVFYYPVHFRVRRWGERTAMVVATLVVFVMTWGLHSYQWFWLLGSFPVSATDILFWGSLALLLIANSLYEAKHGRMRTRRERTAAARIARAIQMALTFTTICLLWSLWMSPTLGEWRALWSVNGVATAALLFPLLVLVMLVADAVMAPAARRGLALAAKRSEPPFMRTATSTAGMVLVMYAVSLPSVTGLFGASAAGVLASIRSGELSPREQTQLHRGYYEDLTGVGRLNSQLWEVYSQRPVVWPSIENTPASRTTNDFQRFELLPSVTMVYLGAPFSTNRWAMRDRDYAKVKPPGTHRWALLGASVEMGWGIGDGETFEQVAEERLNREARGATRYEILNFAASGTLPQQPAVLERALTFGPDVVVLAGHVLDSDRMAEFLIERNSKGVRIPDDSLRALAEGAGLGTELFAEVRRHLLTIRGPLLSLIYRRIVERCLRANVLPVFVLVPTLEATDPADRTEMLRLASDAGFTVLDLHGAYGDLRPATLQITKWDLHPNARGHRLIAEQWLRALHEHPEILQAVRSKDTP